MQQVTFSPLNLTEGIEITSDRTPTELSSRNEEATLSDNEAVITIIKCAIGAGTFTLPYAFMLGGLVFSVIGTMCIGLISAYSLYLLTHCESAVHKTGRYVGKVISYSLLGEVAFPELCININGTNVNLMSNAITTAIVLTSISVSAVYLDFISGVLYDILEIDMSRNCVLFAIFPFLLLLVHLKDYTLLSKLATVGNLSVFGGTLTTIIYGFQNPSINGKISTLIQTEPSNITAFLGDTTFLFAIHVVMLPLLQKMKNREQVSSVIITSYTVITFVNIIFASLSMFLFANSVCLDLSFENGQIGPCGNILGNISNGGVLVAIKLFICIDLLFTIPLVMSASTEVIETYLASYFLLISTVYREIITLYLVRTVFSLVVLSLALIVPNTAGLISAVGGLVCAFAGYIVPSVLYLKICQGTISPLAVCCAGSITLFGITMVCIVIINNIML